MTSDYKCQIQKLSRVIDESLTLLEQAQVAKRSLTFSDVPVPSLLDQCLELCEQHQTQVQEPVRQLYHFGLPVDSALIPSLATLANTRLLSDGVLENENRPDAEGFSGEGGTIRDFEQIWQDYTKTGQRLLVCENPCLTKKQPERPEMQWKTSSIIVACDPVVSYHMYFMQEEGLGQPLAFEDYCQHILDFINEHQHLPMMFHEDFMSDPHMFMKQICREFNLPFNPNFHILADVYAKNPACAGPAVKPTGKKAYRQLCEVLGYDLDFDVFRDPDIEQSHLQEMSGIGYLLKDLTLEELETRAEADDLASVSWARSAIQWQRKDWENLFLLRLRDINRHGDRERLALMLASAYQQTDQYDKAREYSRLALKWGCPREALLNVMTKHVKAVVERAKAHNGKINP